MPLLDEGKDVPQSAKREGLRILCRLFSALVPIGLACAFKSIKTVIVLAGLLGFMLNMVLPPLGHILSSRAILGNTVYTSWTGHPFVVWTIFLVAVAATVTAFATAKF